MVDFLLLLFVFVFIIQNNKIIKGCGIATRQKMTVYRAVLTLNYCYSRCKSLNSGSGTFSYFYIEMSRTFALAGPQNKLRPGQLQCMEFTHTILTYFVCN